MKHNSTIWQQNLNLNKSIRLAVINRLKGIAEIEFILTVL